MTRKLPSSTARGLGQPHRRRRERLLARHRDGDPCPCLELNDCGTACPCRAAGHGLPMYKDPARNTDGRPLEADHTISRADGGAHADRLLLATCNRSRGRGGRATAHLQEPQPWWTRDWTGTGALA